MKELSRMATATPVIATPVANPPRKLSPHCSRNRSSRKEMRMGEVITAEVVRVDYNFVVVNAGLKSEASSRSKNSRTTRAKSKSSPATSSPSPSSRWKTATARRVLSRDKAKRLAAWLDLEAAMEQGTIVAGCRQRQGQGRPDRHDQRHPRVPAGFAGRHPSGQGHHAVRKQRARLQGHQARPQAQQRRRVAPRGAGSNRRAQSARSCWRRCRKAPSSRASSRTSPTTARSSIWAASTACCTSPTSPGAG